MRYLLSGIVLYLAENTSAIVSTAVVAAGLVLTVAAAGHAMMYKRDYRASVAWVVFIVFYPFIGALTYYLFGVNRIRTRAREMIDTIPHIHVGKDSGLIADDMFHCMPSDRTHIKPLTTIVQKLTEKNLLKGNTINILVNGDQAYPAMLEAICSARNTITLSSFIFANDRIGKVFAEALAAAQRRGVVVKILLDGVGVNYQIPNITRKLKNAGLGYKVFNPTLLPWSTKYINLRNHKKILVVDGEIGFTGGMNIKINNCISQEYVYPIHDTHFRLRGPVVMHLQEAFARDWLFASGERLEGDEWFGNHCNISGDMIARGISDGPDEHTTKTSRMLIGAITCARESILMQTPYFLPDAATIHALGVAAMRGVEVDILIPELNNQKLVQWASTAQLWQILEWGCRVWLVPPPFDHSKLLTVDEIWSLIGSSNLDPRSLRLNFEFNVEVYSEAFANQLADVMQAKKKKSRQVTLGDVDNRPLLVRVRDNAARLLTGYI